jgi:hypothetical protein
VEGLETRELLSTTVPGFSLNGGNLYHTVATQQQLIDTGVQDFSVVKNKVYDLHSDGSLASLNGDGSGKTTLASSITAIASGLDPQGRQAVYSLSADGRLLERTNPGGSGPAPLGGAVSLWKGEGNSQDSLGGDNGQATGTSYTAGVVGQAFHFAGTGDYVKAPATNLPTGKAPRTLDLWVRLDALPTHEAFFAGYGQFGTLSQTFQLGATSGGNVFVSQWGPGDRRPGAVRRGLV